MVGESEIAAAGYANLALGTLISTNWPYIELQDATGGKITRLPNTTAGDSRVVPTIVDKKVTYVISLTGSVTTDSDIAGYMASNGGAVTFRYAVMKALNTDEATVMATDEFTQATLSDAGDTLQLTINVGVL